MTTATVSYKEALAPPQQPVMLRFLYDICSIHNKAKSSGLGKPDVSAFLEAYRQPNPKMGLMDHRSRARLRYKARRAKGLCTRCGNKAVPGMMRCQSCREKVLKKRGAKERAEEEALN
ncbi:Hypothetical protein DPCES_2274 [Desulfitobacterium hafniense]|uniref:Uncharacterized protein n=1 Tax=Desulfitobacterium hafniense TaxID=49338 RepID=A0A098B2Q8_DESHA|nr:hypothetical protein [Desulfitobacterium hafniense]CDX02161.1 Hypothetical protein DPCES_2274 [Desulfitobacterium hafniense]